jgi:tetratricopeptide (TPR) repeat protein
MRGIYDTRPYLWNNSVMTIVLLWALATAAPQAEVAQASSQNPPAVATDRSAEAYQEFLLAHRLEDEKNFDGAAAGYRRAMELDPDAAEIPASLATLMARQGRTAEAVEAAERALKISPTNREAHRVLGTIYASNASSETPRGGNRGAERENVNRAIEHLEQAIGGPGAGTEADLNMRATLARLYLMRGGYDVAIRLLEDLVRQEPGWQDVATLLVQAYEAAGRGDEAIRWLENTVAENPLLYPTLADSYGRRGRWADAADAYEKGLKASPSSVGMRIRYATMLLNAGSRPNAIKARDTLREAAGIRGNDERVLYLLSQAELRSGDLPAAEQTARQLIAQNAANPRGHTALAEALSEQRRYTDLANELAPAVGRFRSGPNASAALALLLPHLGFAYQQVGKYNEAIAVLEEARKVSPTDAGITGELIEAHLAAKHYDRAAELARAARVARPDDVRLAAFEAGALQQSGKVEEAIAVMDALVARRGEDPLAHVALADVYSKANRGAEAVKILRDAQVKFPSETRVTFQLGAAFEQQEKWAEAEAAFREVIKQDPEHAPALNYLGYMLADRGERLDESVELIKRALAIDPVNGSYLDSLGWAYYKAGEFQLAEEHLKRAADQLVVNSVVQDHYGDVLLKLGRLQEAVDRWTQALAGDGDSIDSDEIQRKIRAAREKLTKR